VIASDFIHKSITVIVKPVAVFLSERRNPCAMVIAVDPGAAAWFGEYTIAVSIGAHCMCE
jgi:hypothetical protein